MLINRNNYKLILGKFKIDFAHCFQLLNVNYTRARKMNIEKIQLQYQIDTKFTMYTLMYILMTKRFESQVRSLRKLFTINNYNLRSNEKKVA